MSATAMEQQEVSNAGEASQGADSSFLTAADIAAFIFKPSDMNRGSQRRSG